MWLYKAAVKTELSARAFLWWGCYFDILVDPEEISDASGCHVADPDISNKPPEPSSMGPATCEKDSKSWRI